MGRDAEPARRFGALVMIRSLAVLVVAALVASGERVSAQAQWTERKVPDGMEFRLQNDAGAEIMLYCIVAGAGVWFHLPVGPFPRLALIERVTVRGIPGERRNVPVQLHGNLQWSSFGVVSGTGRDFVFKMLRNAARVFVRVSREVNTSFEVFGSDGIVTQCQNHIEDEPGGPAPPRQPGSGGPTE